ncbi:MAG: AAA family ATPase [Acidimicrobiales bacterium]
MDNPYGYGSPVTGAQFAGRDQELSALESRMANGVNVVVSAPRRYGKTSLILEAVNRIERRRPKASVIHVNLMRCPTVGAFAEQLVSGAHEALHARVRRAASAIPEVLGRLRLQPSVSFDKSGNPNFSFAPSLAERDALQVLADVYAQLATVVDERPAVLILDEFQAVGDLGGGIAPALKGLADQHGKVSMVVAGSRQHMMEALVAVQGAPLYGMAERIALAGVDPLVMEQYLERRAGEGKKPMAPGSAGRILAVAAPVPNDIQRLAYQVFEEAARRIEPVDVGKALEAVIRLEEASFVDRLASIPRGQRAVLVGVARARTLNQPYASEFAREVGYAGPPSVRRAVQALLEDELLVERREALVVNDPFFAEWLRRL